MVNAGSTHRGQSESTVGLLAEKTEDRELVKRFRKAKREHRGNTEVRIAGSSSHFQGWGTKGRGEEVSQSWDSDL